MASGHVNRIYCLTTWLHRPSLRREDFSCQPGAVHTWHFSDVVARADDVTLGAKQTLRLRASRYAFDLRVRPLKPTGGGWSNLCGTIVADRWASFMRKKLKIKYKKPLG